MLRATREQDNPKSCPPDRVRFPGICADAAALGTDRTHLYRVLTGERKSTRLLRAYRELKRAQEAN